MENFVFYIIFGFFSCCCVVYRITVGFEHVVLMVLQSGDAPAEVLWEFFFYHHYGLSLWSAFALRVVQQTQLWFPSMNLGKLGS